MSRAPPLPLRNEAIGDSPLIEYLGRAWVQAARSQAGEVLAFAPFYDGDVDPRQRQFPRQHQPGWTPSGDHHGMLGHCHPPVGIRNSWGTRNKHFFIDLSTSVQCEGNLPRPRCGCVQAAP